MLNLLMHTKRNPPPPPGGANIYPDFRGKSYYGGKMLYNNGNHVTMYLQLNNTSTIHVTNEHSEVK